MGREEVECVRGGHPGHSAWLCPDCPVLGKSSVHKAKETVSNPAEGGLFTSMLEGEADAEE